VTIQVVSTKIDGLWELHTKIFKDQRGFFVKTFHEPTLRVAGLNTIWREHFWSASGRDVIRGLHFQIPPCDHAKLVSCAAGAIWDVAVDLRRGSFTYGRHVARELSAENGIMMYIPRGMAHGFMSLTNGSVVLYAVETPHDPECDRGIRWDSCGVPWPLNSQPVISARDDSFPALSDFESPFLCEPVW
jgi:dTDP-4-dehydrorhamnose 3,5-epimerase